MNVKSNQNVYTLTENCLSIDKIVVYILLIAFYAIALSISLEPLPPEIDSLVGNDHVSLCELVWCSMILFSVSMGYGLCEYSLAKHKKRTMTPIHAHTPAYTHKKWRQPKGKDFA